MYDANGKNIGGCPTKCTPELTKKFIDALELGMPLCYAIQLVHITEETYYNWMERGEKGEEPFFTFFEGVNSAEPNFINANLKLLQDHAKQTPQAAQWLLERKAAQFFSRNQTRIKLRKAAAEASQTDKLMDYTNQIIEQVAAGKMSVEDAKAATSVIEEQRKVNETILIKERLDQIDAKLKAAARE